MILFHGSRQNLPIGFKLIPQEDGYVNQPDVIDFELLVESRRPLHLTSRFDSIYLVEDPEVIDYAGGYNDHIYEVKTDNIHESSDLSWYSLASLEYNDGFDFDINKINFFIDKYWSSEINQERKNSVIEYRASSGIITALL